MDGVFYASRETFNLMDICSRSPFLNNRFFALFHLNGRTRYCFSTVSIHDADFNLRFAVLYQQYAFRNHTVGLDATICIDGKGEVICQGIAIGGYGLMDSELFAST